MTLETRDAIIRNGDELSAAVQEFTLGLYDLYERDFETARATLTAALDTIRRLGHPSFEAETLRYLGVALLGLGRRTDAGAAFAEALAIATSDSLTPTAEITDALGGIALAANPAHEDRADRLRGAVAHLRQHAKLAGYPRLRDLERHFEQPLIDALGQEAWDREHAAGATLTFEETIEIARSLAGAT